MPNPSSTIAPLDLAALPVRVAQPRLGGWDHVTYSALQTAQEWRWESSILGGLGSSGVLEAALPIHVSRPVKLDGSDVAAELALTGPLPERVALLGGFAFSRGGGFIGRTDAGQTDSSALFERLILKAYELCSGATLGREATTVAAVAVPEDQLGIFVQSWPVPVRVQLTGAWYALRLHGAETINEFLSALPRRPRQVWARDLRDEAELQYTESEPLSEELIDELAVLIALVDSRNGNAGHSRLVECRLRVWQKLSRELVVFTMRDNARRLVGGCLARVTDAALEVCEIGLVEDHPLRRQVYANLGFVQPLRFALGRGIDRLEFGRGHAKPKVLHGAQPVRLYTLRDGVLSREFGGRNEPMAANGYLPPRWETE